MTAKREQKDAGPAWVTQARAYFTTLGPNEQWDERAIDRRIEAALEDGANVLMCFVQDEGYALWPTALVPVAPRAEERDLVGLLVDRSHAAGLLFVAQWMGVHVQTVLANRHPGWLQRDAEGAAAAAMCLNSPFGGLLLRQIAEVARRYEIDGVYLDGLYARVGACYCAYCHLAFPATFGRPLSVDQPLTRSQVRTGEHWLDLSTAAGEADPDLHAFRFATVEGHVRRLRRALDDARPGVALLLDTLGVQAAYWPNAQNLARLRDSVDAFVLECYPDQIREPLWHVAFETELTRAEGRRPIWLLRWLARDPDGDLVSVPATTIELHAGAAIAHGASPVAVEMNLLSVDPSLRSVVRTAFNDVAAVFEADGQEPVAYAAILDPESTRDALHPRGRARDLYDALAGAYLALVEAALPVRFVTEEDIRGERLPSDLRTIVLAGASHLSPATVEGLAAFVARGGGLVATHRAGFGFAADATSLSGLLQVETAGVAARAGRIGTELLGGQELVSYYRTASDQPILEGLGDRLFSFSGPYTRLVSHEGSDLGAVLDADDAAMDGERWFGWYPGAPSSILGMARKSGQGRVVYLAVPFESVFFREGRPEAAEILAASIRWAANALPPVAVRAPASVESVIRRRTSGGWSIALANRATNELYAIGPGVSMGAASSSASAARATATTTRAQHPRYVVPVAGVSIQVPAEGRERSARSLRHGSLPVMETETGNLEVIVPRLDAYDVVTIE